MGGWVGGWAYHSIHDIAHQGTEEDDEDTGGGGKISGSLRVSLEGHGEVVGGEIEEDVEDVDVDGVEEGEGPVKVDEWVGGWVGKGEGSV